MAADDELRPRQLRLILPVQINYLVRKLALREGRSDSAMCVRLIGEALDWRARQEKEPNEELRRFVEILKTAIAPSTPVAA
jgi:hypothetical protein